MEKTVKKTLSLLLVVLLIASLSACGTRTTPDGGETEGSKYGGTFVIGFDDPGSANLTGPASEVGIIGYTMWTGGSLIIADPLRYSFLPAIADTWEKEEDGNYLFHIREGVTWHDGEPFTAQDVEFSAEYWAREGFDFDVYWGFLANGIDATVEAVDDANFRIVLNAPTAENTLFQYIALYLHVIPKHIWEEVEPADFLTNPASQNPVGAGPWKFVEYVSGEYLKYEAFEDYWNGRPYFDNLIVSFPGDSDAIYNALNAGELDLSMYLDPEYVKQIENENTGLLRIDEELGVNVAALLPNLSRTLGDLEVRKAIAHLLNKQEIIDTAYGGIGYVHNSILPQLAQYYNDDVTVKYEYSIETAKSILEADGYTLGADGIYQKDGKPLHLEYIYSGSSSSAALPLYLQSIFKQAGIELELVGLEAAALTERRAAGEWDLRDGRYALGTDPSGYRRLIVAYAPDSPEGDALTALFDEALALESGDEKQAKYEEIQKLFSEQVVFYPLQNGVLHTVVNARLVTDEAIFSTSTSYLYWDKLYYAPAS